MIKSVVTVPRSIRSEVRKSNRESQPVQLAGADRVNGLSKKFKDLYSDVDETCSLPATKKLRKSSEKAAGSGTKHGEKIRTTCVMSVDGFTRLDWPVKSINHTKTKPSISFSQSLASFTSNDVSELEARRATHHERMLHVKNLLDDIVYDVCCQLNEPYYTDDEQSGRKHHKHKKSKKRKHKHRKSVSANAPDPEKDKLDETVSISERSELNSVKKSHKSGKKGKKSKSKKQKKSLESQNEGADSTKRDPGSIGKTDEDKKPNTTPKKNKNPAAKHSHSVFESGSLKKKSSHNSAKSTDQKIKIEYKALKSGAPIPTAKSKWDTSSDEEGPSSTHALTVIRFSDDEKSIPKPSDNIGTFGKMDQLPVKPIPANTANPTSPVGGPLQPTTTETATTSQAKEKSRSRSRSHTSRSRSRSSRSRSYSSYTSDDSHYRSRRRKRGRRRRSYTSPSRSSSRSTSYSRSRSYSRSYSRSTSRSRSRSYRRRSYSRSSYSSYTSYSSRSRSRSRTPRYRPPPKYKPKFNIGKRKRKPRNKNNTYKPPTSVQQKINEEKEKGMTKAQEMIYKLQAQKKAQEEQECKAKATIAAAASSAGITLPANSIVNVSGTTASPNTTAVSSTSPLIAPPVPPIGVSAFTPAGPYFEGTNPDGCLFPSQSSQQSSGGAPEFIGPIRPGDPVDCEIPLPATQAAPRTSSNEANPVNFEPTENAAELQEQAAQFMRAGSVTSPHGALLPDPTNLPPQFTVQPPQLPPQIHQQLQPHPLLITPDGTYIDPTTGQPVQPVFAHHPPTSSPATSQAETNFENPGAPAPHEAVIKSYADQVIMSQYKALVTQSQPVIALASSTQAQTVPAIGAAIPQAGIPIQAGANIVALQQQAAIQQAQAAHMHAVQAQAAQAQHMQFIQLQQLQQMRLAQLGAQPGLAQQMVAQQLMAQQQPQPQLVQLPNGQVVVANAGHPGLVIPRP